MQVLYEDNHIIAVSKTVNELVQGDKTGDKCLIDSVKEYIKNKYEKSGDVFVGLPHRLDRPTSGIVVFARTSKALARLNAMFATKEVKKTYWAITSSIPEKSSGELRNYLIRNEKLNKSFISQEGTKDSKLAILDYEIIAHTDRYHLWQINLQTGRHHQIRCQLAAINCPVKGDLKYGFSRSNPDGGICLHARRIQFVHPVSKIDIDIVAPVPDDNLWKACESAIKKD